MVLASAKNPGDGDFAVMEVSYQSASAAQINRNGTITAVKYLLIKRQVF